MRMAAMSGRQPGMGNCTGRAAAGHGGGGHYAAANRHHFGKKSFFFKSFFLRKMAQKAGIFAAKRAIV